MSSSSSTQQEITLSARGPRELVSVEEAATILARWQQQLEGEDIIVNKLDLSCRVWTVPALQVLQPVLEQIKPTLEDLVLDDIIASLPTEEGLATLEFLSEVFEDSPCLKAVYLDDNALGTRGVEKLRKILSNRYLKILSFYNDGMSLEVAQALLALLLPHAHNLTHLALGRNQIGKGAEQVADLVRGCENLETFAYNGSRPLKAGSLQICKALANLKNLQTLNLEDTVLGDGQEGENDGVHHLCICLRQNPNMRKLILNDSGLKADGVSMVLEALGASRAPLEYLDLGIIDLGSEGCEYVVTYLQDCGASLVELHLENNELDDDCITTLLPGLRACTNLQVLNLSENFDIGEDGLRRLAEERIPSLQKLLLKEIEVDDDVLQELKNAYRRVVLDDEQEAEEEEVGKEVANEGDVDDLAAALGAANI